MRKVLICISFFGVLLLLCGGYFIYSLYAKSGDIFLEYPYIDYPEFVTGGLLLSQPTV